MSELVLNFLKLQSFDLLSLIHMVGFCHILQAMLLVYIEMGFSVFPSPQTHLQRILPWITSENICMQIST